MLLISCHVHVSYFFNRREENMNEDKVNNVMSSIHRSSTEDQSIPKETSQNLKAKLLWKSGTKATPVYTTPVKNGIYYPFTIIMSCL
jgi:hypothetical protein